MVFCLRRFVSLSRAESLPRPEPLESSCGANPCARNPCVFKNTAESGKHGLCPELRVHTIINAGASRPQGECKSRRAYARTVGLQEALQTPAIHKGRRITL